MLPPPFPEEVDAVVGGYHADPFRILGPHQVKEETSMVPRWEVRLFDPAAVAMKIWSHGRATEMKRVHADGFWNVTLEQSPGHYQLEGTYADGVAHRFEDPYRFPPLISAFDLHLHTEGTLYEGYRMLGAHLVACDGVEGVRFSVWAPNAYLVSVVGDFNSWDARRHPMRLRDGGVWELFIPHVPAGVKYKYSIQSNVDGLKFLKTDPYGFFHEIAPATASIVCDIDSYQWRDQEWMEKRAETDSLKKPVSMYEVHLGSWMLKPDGSYHTYRELADYMIPYVKEMGFTHIELMPMMEHPFTGSWGYQVTGFFAPTSRWGTPDDFMFFVDRCHQEGIGIILDWVPAHFPRDAHGLARFDGTALYEHADPRQGEHRDWGTLIFNYGRTEIRSFLISSALFWLKHYHLDGLRVDAVASMLYLDYSRNSEGWVPNIYGGNENLEAIDFIRRFNEMVHTVPGAISIAEESTSFGGVTRPVYLNGVGFTMKWNMGWMHDMLAYFKQDPIYRKFHHNKITFSLLYAFTENFLLPISHDEVVHGKASLLAKMPGDEWQRFANNRAFFAYMWTHPGKKLVFMGTELGQYEEWWEGTQIRWDLLQYERHRKLQFCLKTLNRLYLQEPALYEVDYHWNGFEWLDISDYQGSIISFVRRAKDRNDFLVIVCNFTPAIRRDYRIGVPAGGLYRELFNSDSDAFGGSNVGNNGAVMADAHPQHGRDYSVSLTLPPLAVVILKPPPPPVA